MSIPPFTLQDVPFLCPLCKHSSNCAATTFDETAISCPACKQVIPREQEPTYIVSAYRCIHTNKHRYRRSGMEHIITRTQVHVAPLIELRPAQGKEKFNWICPICRYSVLTCLYSASVNGWWTRLVPCIGCS